MQTSWVTKGLVCGIILLFIGTNIPTSQSGNSTIQPNVLSWKEKNPGYIPISNETHYYALIIGVEKFDNGTLPGEFLDDSAMAIYEKLLNSSNWKKENIKLLLNENATKADIQDAIVHWLGERVTKNDVVLYYFCGHSWRMTLKYRLQGLTGHTVTYPYDKSTNRITDIELDSWFDQIQSEHVVMILDTCYSGKMTALIQNGRTILAAGGKYLLCPVDEDQSLKSGIFTFFLLQGFNGVADINDDGWVTAEEVFHYARWPTFHFSLWLKFPFNKDLPMIIGPQIPYMYDRIPGQERLINLSQGNFTVNK